MGRIYFIRAAAFLSSIIAKIIAVPFILLVKALSSIAHGIRSLSAFVLSCCKNRRENGKRKKAARKAAALKRKEEKARRKSRKQKKKKRPAKKEKSKQKKQKKIRRKKPSGILKAIEKLSRKYPKSKLIYTMKRVYWVSKTLAGKAYWFLKGLLQKLYWMFHGIYTKIYWIVRTLLQKGYWFFRTRYQKFYWFFRTRLQKFYWFFRTLFQKTYWFFRTQLQRRYWFFRTLLQKAYWFFRTQAQKMYWNFYYPKSRKLYQTLSRNPYMDLYLTLLREYMKRSDCILLCVPITDGAEYVKHHARDTSYQVVESGRIRPVCIPAYFEKSREQIEEFQSPDIYIAEIRNVSLIGASNALIADNALLNDAASHDKEKRIDIRYSCIKNVLNGVATIEDTGEKEEEIERGINLVGAASFNYYHLTVEILSRLTFTDRYEKFHSYPVLVDEVVLRIPQFKSALDCINKYRHPIIRIEKGKKYLIRDMVLPSSNVWMPTNIYNRDLIRTEDFLISATVLNNIRNAVGIWQESTPWRKIFISRKNTQAVRLKNEETVRSIFAENGFEIIYTEELSFRQQVECFGQAKYVVAASGAALTNTIFCQPGALIGCIIPSEHRFYMYSTIAYLLGLKTLFLDAEITERTPYAAADTFVLDTDYVKRYIRHINSIEQNTATHT